MNSQLKTILVTGGCGFAGSSVVPLLLEKTDASIAVLDNLFNGRREYLPNSPRVSLHQTELTDETAVRTLVGTIRPHLVVHLAALHFIPYCNAHPGETLQVNVVGTQNLLEACRAHPPEKIVAASSMAIYPIKEGACVEQDLAGPTDIYGLSKQINEQQLELFAKQTGIRCAAARLSNLYGPRETNPHVIPEIFEQVVQGKTELALGNVKPLRDYIYVTDVAEALLAMAEESRHAYRVYNVGTGVETSVEEIVNKLAEISGCKLTIRVAADRVRKSDRMHLLTDPGRLKDETGWRPKYDIDRGLAELWKWYQEISTLKNPAAVSFVG